MTNRELEALAMALDEMLEKGMYEEVKKVIKFMATGKRKAADKESEE